MSAELTWDDLTLDELKVRKENLEAKLDFIKYESDELITDDETYDLIVEVDNAIQAKLNRIKPEPNG